MSHTHHHDAGATSQALAAKASNAPVTKTAEQIAAEKEAAKVEAQAKRDAKKADAQTKRDEANKAKEVKKAEAQAARDAKKAEAEAVRLAKASETQADRDAKKAEAQAARDAEKATKAAERTAQKDAQKAERAQKKADDKAAALAEKEAQKTERKAQVEERAALVEARKAQTKIDGERRTKATHIVYTGNGFSNPQSTSTRGKVLEYIQENVPVGHQVAIEDLAKACKPFLYGASIRAYLSKLEERGHLDFVALAVAEPEPEATK